MSRINLQKGLIGHWTMESINNDALRDKTAYDNYGDIINNPVVIDGFIGENALEFDGSNDYVDVGLENKLETINEMTIAGWAVWGQDTIESSYNPVVGKWYGSEDSVFMLTWSYHDRVWFYLNNDEGNWTRISYDIDVSKIHHCVGVYTGSEIKLYVDGVERDSASYSDEVMSNQMPVAIAGHGGRFEGMIDDVRVYDRALTEQEIKTLYNMRNQQVRRV